jgi:hypothetical protein
LAPFIDLWLEGELLLFFLLFEQLLCLYLLDPLLLFLKHLFDVFALVSVAIVLLDRIMGKFIGLNVVESLRLYVKIVFLRNRGQLLLLVELFGSRHLSFRYGLVSKAELLMIR